MSKIFTVVTLILNIIFEIYRTECNIVRVLSLKQAITQVDSSTEAYTQLHNSIISGYFEIAVCCVLILLSVTACVLVIKKKSNLN